MSSGSMPRTQHPELFLWSDALDRADYAIARYRVASVHDGDATAMAMAMEQSAATTHIAGHVVPAMLHDWTLRVRSVRALDPPGGAGLAPYTLATEVYADGGDAERGRSNWRSRGGCWRASRRSCGMWWSARSRGSAS